MRLTHYGLLLIMYGNSFLNHSSAGPSVTESPDIFNLVTPALPSDGNTSPPFYLTSDFISYNPPLPDDTSAPTTPRDTQPSNSALSHSTASPSGSQQPELEALLESNTQDSLFQLHNKGHFDKRCRAGELVWELECPSCKGWVRTSIGHALSDAFTVPGHFAALVNHRASRKCFKARQAHHSKSTHREALQLVHSNTDLSLVSAPAYPAHRTMPSQTTFPDDGYENFAPNLRNIAFIGTRTEHHFSSPYFPPQACYNPRRCSGAILDWNVPHGPLQDNFPWSRPTDGPDSLPFYVLTTDVDVRARSKRCVGVVMGGQQQCEQCTLMIPRIAELADMATFSRHGDDALSTRSAL
ncbi:hypothetical protein BV22DRAFT_1134770 [Leucogyrophana mollusca]|uniref:Uncharacterized protein n=1 Tax=Leucogyrophana mollusca TaxID=85980 RepID=A0ACB8AY80_9AGAM|nr:hypothetical protein BV22DRAFT_1134770 [Leucogyrophana mollusca]